EAALRRAFAPDDLAPLLARTGYGGTVAVQAREVEAETGYLLSLARTTPSILGVVGWVDLCAADVEDRLDRAAADPKLRGLRMVIHDHPDRDFAASPGHVRGVSALAARGLTYDLLIRTEHIPAALVLVDACPDVRFVVDHLAKPRLDGSDWSPWRAGIDALGARPNVWCKLSGLGTLPGPGRPHRFLDTALAAFGPARCMIGSDWPVATLAADYAGTMAVVEAWCAPLAPDERALILGETCARFYRLDRGEDRLQV
ncbi:MAG: amidohydrolase family protein, partial [Janthinobacterium lividum]